MLFTKLFIVGLLVIGPAIDAAPNKIFPLRKNYNYISMQNSGQQYAKPAGYGQPCYGGCEQGLICSRDRVCACPTGFVYSSDLNGCVNCPSPWILVKGSCIQYLGNGSVLSWNQARSKCQAIGADLMDVNFDTFFEYAETFIDTFLNNTDFPTFYAGVKAENPSFFSYESVFSKAQIPAFSNLWRCNFVNNYICICDDIYTKEESCFEIGNALGFNDTFPCKRCSYVSYGANVQPYSESNQTLRLYPIDCDSPDVNITNYICQKPIQYSQYTNNYYQISSNNYNYKRAVYSDKKCNNIPTFVTSTKCYSDQECSNNLVCNNYYCSCPYGYHLINNSECKRCPVGWVHYDGYCYYISNEKLNWGDAITSCFGNRSTLIDIDSYPSYPSRLFSFLRCFGLDDTYWIGAFKASANWKKLNDLTNFQLTSFEPNRQWYELNQFSCDSDSATYYQTNHGSDNVMSVNGAANSIESGQYSQLFKYICQFKLDQPSNLNYTGVMQTIQDTIII